MSEKTPDVNVKPAINAPRLFLGSCIALIATSVSFAVISEIMGSLKAQFILTNYEVGLIGGAAIWGFTISIFVLGPLCDALGMKKLVWLAFLGHAIGVLLMIFSKDFWPLFWGALIMAMGNGTVEAVCNPLVATIYPDQKTKKLNQFHVWFPGGIVIGGLICFALSKLEIDSWQIRLGVILIPTVIYGILFIGQKFPATERVQSGVSFGQMFKATFFRPLFLILFGCMMITASIELGPSRWIPSILKAGGMPGILVLVWITGLMAVLRYFAGAFVHRFSPTGLLLISAVLSGIGLFWLSYAESIAMAVAAATVFAVGVCYFWPTMLGVVAERVPKGGALALAMMGGIGMLAVGLIATPLIGGVIDKELVVEIKPDATILCLEDIVEAYPALIAKAEGNQKADIQKAVDDAKAVLAKVVADNGKLPHPDTANALRAAIGVGGDSKAAKKAGEILNPAENYGGRMSFRKIAPVAIILVVVFGFLYIQDLKKGGYKAEEINA